MTTTLAIRTENESPLGRLLAGDEMALHVLIEQESGALMLVAEHYLDQSIDARRVVQETWLSVIRGLGAVDELVPLRASILSTLFDHSMVHAAYRRRRACLAEGIANDVHELMQAGYAQARRRRDEHALGVERWPRADEPEAKRTEPAVWEAIDALTPTARRVLLLRDRYGWSHDEVGEALTIDPIAQRHLLGHARQSVRDALDLFFQRPRPARHVA